MDKRCLVLPTIRNHFCGTRKIPRVQPFHQIIRCSPIQQDYIKTTTMRLLSLVSSLAGLLLDPEGDCNLVKNQPATQGTSPELTQQQLLQELLVVRRTKNAPPASANITINHIHAS